MSLASALLLQNARWFDLGEEIDLTAPPAIYSFKKVPTGQLFIATAVRVAFRADGGATSLTSAATGNIGNNGTRNNVAVSSNQLFGTLAQQNSVRPMPIQTSPALGISTLGTATCELVSTSTAIDLQITVAAVLNTATFAKARVFLACFLVEA